MKFVLLSFFIAYFSVSTGFPSETKFHIVLDPGHGGPDLGATRNSFIESKIVFQIARKVKAQLDRQKNITATLTRNETQGLSLKDRVLLAHELKADLFVSLHANTSNWASISGVEFYFNSNGPSRSEFKEPTASENHHLSKVEVIEKIKNDFLFYDKTERSLLLAQSFKSVQEQSPTLKTKQKITIRRAPFYVLDQTSMPSALIELGFISNLREAKKLSSEEYQNELAQRLATALLEYKEKSDKL